MNNHLQPAMPPAPDRFVYAAACKYPDIIDPSGLQINHVPARRKSSGPLYHDPRMKCVPAKTGASSMPTTKTLTSVTEDSRGGGPIQELEKLTTAQGVKLVHVRHLALRERDNTPENFK